MPYFNISFSFWVENRSKEQNFPIHSNPTRDRKRSDKRNKKRICYESSVWQVFFFEIEQRACPLGHWWPKLSDFVGRDSDPNLEITHSFSRTSFTDLVRQIIHLGWQTIHGGWSILHLGCGPYSGLRTQNSKSIYIWDKIFRDLVWLCIQFLKVFHY